MLDLSNAQTRRILLLIGLFVLFVAVGTASLRWLGGTSGNLAFDIYLVLTLFALNGDVVFSQPTNTVIQVQAFLAPVFTILSLLELITHSFYRRVEQSIRLWLITDHTLLVGLRPETLLLLRSLKSDQGNNRIVVIDPAPSEQMASECRRLGALVLAADPGSSRVLEGAAIARARRAISFLPNATDALQFLLSTSTIFRETHRTRSIDAWICLQDAALGQRLGEYFKFAGLSAEIHPRFFSLDEIAARSLVRAHPIDIYADVLGQSRLHLAVYGFNQLSVQVIIESLRQCLTTDTEKPKLTVLTQDTEAARTELFALLPQIKTVCDCDFRILTVRASGVSDQDYETIPEDVSAHIVCYESPDKAASVAISLRRMLLMPPAAAEPVSSRRANAPILTRLTNTHGIGELLRSNVDLGGQPDEQLVRSTQKAREIPDGIFAFGAIEDLLSGARGDNLIPTLIDPQREAIAKFLHYTYVRQRESQRSADETPDEDRSRAEEAWDRLAPEFRDSSRQGADHLYTKARVLGLRVADKPHGEHQPVRLSEAEHRLLAELEHRRWMTERLLGGWSFGEKRVDAARRHPMLRPWSELPASEAQIDAGFITRLNEAAGGAGLCLKRDVIIGVVGSLSALSSGAPPPTQIVDLEKAVYGLIEKHDGKTPVLMTSLGPGLELAVAELAERLRIPCIVPLPLPFEAYCQDFLRHENGSAQLDLFFKLIAGCERYFELPLKFGNLSDVTLTGKDLPQARLRQYGLARAFIAEHATELLLECDAEASFSEPGSIQDVAAWRKAGCVPSLYATQPVFRRRPDMTPAIVLQPNI